MTHAPFRIALAAAALFALAACETTDETASNETIQWNTPPVESPAQPPAQPQAVPPSPETSPAPPPAGAAPEPQCREYQTTVTIGGKPQKAYGRACRQPDGTWKNVGELKDTPHAATPGAQVENSYPYGWYGYDYPHGPRYGPGGMSVGVGAGNRGGWFGYGVGF